MLLLGAFDPHLRKELFGSVGITSESLVAVVS
jgi:hypothetical protein